MNIYQLHISERSGRGVPVITQVYGKEAFEFRENSIVVTIPFKKVTPEVGDVTFHTSGNNGTGWIFLQWEI